MADSGLEMTRLNGGQRRTGGVVAHYVDLRMHDDGGGDVADESTKSFSDLIGTGLVVAQ
jgi:hypothetical protein